jgi:hypothetical protein
VTLPHTQPQRPVSGFAIATLVLGIMGIVLPAARPRTPTKPSPSTTLRSPLCRNGGRFRIGNASSTAPTTTPGNYVFTFQNGRPPHPDTIIKRFDRVAAQLVTKEFSILERFRNE